MLVSLTLKNSNENIAVIVTNRKSYDVFCRNPRSCLKTHVAHAIYELVLYAHLKLNIVRSNAANLGFDFLF
jgi:hypothetical protein